MDLYDCHGERKYLTTSELRTFLAGAKYAEPQIRTLCETIAHSGCRLSEALLLTAGRVDLSDGVLIFESLKKRKRGVYRAVPIPPELLELLSATHNLAGTQQREGMKRGLRLWPFSRVTAWRRIHEVMRSAGLTGAHATPRGLRHSFGTRAVSSGVPLHIVQRWLGHARLSTSAIYANAIGPEERQLAARMWNFAPAIPLTHGGHAYSWGTSQTPGLPPFSGP